jgi:hypothetical protein
MKRSRPVRRWQAPVLVVALLVAGCGSQDETGKSPGSAFSTPTDGSVRIPQRTVEYGDHDYVWVKVS